MAAASISEWFAEKKKKDVIKYLEYNLHFGNCESYFIFLKFVIFIRALDILTFFNISHRNIN